MVFAGYAIMMRMIMIIEHRLQDMDLYVCQIRSVVVPCFAVGGSGMSKLGSGMRVSASYQLR